MLKRAAPPPPQTPLDVVRTLARAYVIDGVAPLFDAATRGRLTRLETAGLMIRLIVTAYGALLCASLVSATAKRGVKKIHDGARANAHLVRSNEKKWKKSKTDPKELALRATKTKTIVFIRHGESTWNEVFNRKFDHTFPGRIIGGVVTEILRFFTNDSFFLDSPLSEKGVEQAKALREFFTNEKRLRETGVGGRERGIIDTIVGLQGRSIIVSSNLRRAVNTTVHALWCRLSNTAGTEKVLIHSALQEMARNVDTYALASNKGDVVPTGTLAKELGVKTIDASAMFDASANAGQKKINRKGVDSMREFAAWAMNQDADVIIAGGHSIWFREFFKAHLPFDSTCAGKTKKIVNCGVVSFDLQFGVHPEHGEMYAIEPQSVNEVYGGFAK